MQKRSLVAIFLLLMFLFMQVNLNLANPRLKSEIIITDETLNQYVLILNFPEQIWLGQSEKITIQLLKDTSQNGLTNAQQDKSEYGFIKIQNFEVDFILTGAELSPPGVFITPLMMEKDLVMNWEIMPNSNEDVDGTVWIYIITISNDNENENQKELIFTRNFTFNIKSVFGLKIDGIQWVLNILTLIIIIYLYRSVKKGMSGMVSKNEKLL